MALEKIFSEMWSDYISFNPHAKAIYDAFVGVGEQVVNDHIALRSYRWGGTSMRPLIEYFQRLGYQVAGEYQFKEKKLYAQHLENGEYPKVFISELLVDQLSPKAQGIVSALLAQVPASFWSRDDLPWAGRPWTITWQDYQSLAAESEYAAWVAAHGFRPNHFTVSVNHLKQLDSIEKVNNFLLGRGFNLNSSGGLIKGSPTVFLEQSSTMAGHVSVAFADGSHEVPACYYEFAKRYPMPNGQLYQGFVEKSADKIFESTNASMT
ncbi:MAG: DUF1338 domain-containing protein [Bdellovibrionaceae bacterium]|jgi:hypothetical protein|nr:DUF1338 domain-containing protein [Pseudobdellovibrionaceae bacterium]